MKQILLSYSIFILIFTTSKAQQIPLTSAVRQSWTEVNPGAIPREAIELREISTLLNLNYRYQQHIVASQVPNITGFRIEHILGEKDNYSKISSFLNRETDGIINTTSMSGNYAKLLHLGLKANKTRSSSHDFGDLSIGGTLTYRHRTVRTDQVTWNNPSLFPPVNSNYLNLNIGAFWYFNLPSSGGNWSTNVYHSLGAKKPYGYVGVSSIQSIQIGKTDYLKDVNQWNGIAGIVWQSLELSTWVRYISKTVFLNDNNQTLPISADLSFRYFFKRYGNSPSDPQLGNGLWFGGGISSAKMLSLESGIRYWLDEGRHAHYIQIGIAYTGLPLSTQSISRPNSIELNLSLNFAPNDYRSKKKRRR